MKLFIFTVDFGECLIEAYNDNGFYLIRVPKGFIENNRFYMRQKVRIRRKYFITGDFILRLEWQGAKYNCAFMKIEKPEDMSAACLKLYNQ
ncbi:MAG: hypothetical protein ACYCUW_01740 [bacterium]